jgi:hypothetical protein
MFSKIRKFDAHNDGIVTQILGSGVAILFAFVPLLYVMGAGVPDVLNTIAWISALMAVGAAAHAYGEIFPHGFKTTLEIRRLNRAIKAR